MLILKSFLFLIISLSTIAATTDCKEMKRVYDSEHQKWHEFHLKAEKTIHDCLLNPKPMPDKVEEILNGHAAVIDKIYNKKLQPLLRSTTSCYKTKLNPLNALIVTKRMYDSGLVYLIKYCTKRGREISKQKLSFNEEKKLLKTELLNICGDRCKLFGSY